MDAADLAVFAAVARAGGMNRAAGALHTVQSNITQRVRGLEESLGVALFTRHSRGVTLTEAGARLLPYAERLADLLAEARRAVAETGEPAGALTIGALETNAAMRLPPLLRDYAAAWPLVDISLHTGTTERLVLDVLSRRLEGAFVAGPVQHAELAEEVMFVEELVLATPPELTTLQAALAARRAVVFPAGCSYRRRMEALLREHGAGMGRRLEFGTLDGIIGCVAAGLGVTMLPRPVFTQAVTAGHVRLHTLPERHALAPTCFVRRHDGLLTAALARFLERARAGAGAARRAA